MNSLNRSLVLALLVGTAGVASAVPSLTSLGSGTPLGVTNSIGGTYYMGGSGLSTNAACRWTLTGSTLTAVEIGGTGGSGFISADGLFQTGSFLNTGPQIFGNTATAVSPPHSATPTLVPSTTLPPTTEFAGRRWNSSSNTWQSLGGLPVVGSLGVFGSSSGGQAGSSFLTPNSISATGQFVVGLGYACVYNAAGTTVSANSFRWRPWIWDASANAGAGGITILPTPFKTTSGQTNLRRTGNAYAVSSDGLVVAGATEHNSAVTPGLDVDGGRLVVWRWDGAAYVMSYLNTGTDGSGFPKYQSSTPNSMAMNSAGTIIAARGPDGITKWVWNGVSWGAPIVIGANLTTPASWLPSAVTSCGQPPNLGGGICMSEDGNTIGGTAVYSTCGSFMTGGFIWHASDNLIQDWYDYNVALGTPGCATGGFFGPIGDLGDPSKGLPVLGNPIAISPDASAIVGNQGGTQRIVGAPPWIWQASGGAGCSDVLITSNPVATTNYSACSSSIILNVAAAGTPPLSYQWYKNGVPLSDGPSGFGSNITGATSFQFRITPPAGVTLSTSEVGNYTCTVTGSCGAPAVSTTAVVQLDPAYPPAANDTCAGATVVSMGTNVLAPAQVPCGAYAQDPLLLSTCQSSKADLWFSFTPAASGDFRIETCGASYDTVLSVFDGCGGNELVCNDNVDPNTGPTCSSTRSRINPFALVGGQTYLISVSALNTALIFSSSTLNLSITAAPTVPANDDCNAAMVVSTGTTPFNTTEALATGGLGALPCAASANLSRDLWYSYTPALSGKLSASTCPQGTASGGYALMNNTVLSFYDAACGNVIACNDNMPTTPGCGSQLSQISLFNVAAGVPVFVRVSGTNATTFGQGQLTLSFFCAADFNNDGVIDFFDYLDYVDAFSSGLPSADFNGDTVIDFFDYLDFVDAFSAGCA